DGRLTRTLPLTGAWVENLHVDAALRFAAARPAARAGVVRVDGGPRARLAADRRIALLQQRIDGHVVIGDVALHVEVRPGGQRIDLHHAPQVPRHDRGAGPLGGP